VLLALKARNSRARGTPRGNELILDSQRAGSTPARQLISIARPQATSQSAEGAQLNSPDRQVGDTTKQNECEARRADMALLNVEGQKLETTHDSGPSDLEIVCHS